MEPIARVVENKDWITFTFLGIGFLMVLVNFLDQKRFQHLILLPFSSIYFTLYEDIQDNVVRIFSILLFLASNLTISVLLYFLYKIYLPKEFDVQTHVFIKIWGLLLLYWTIRNLLGKFLAWVFSMEAERRIAAYVKMSYFFSVNFYLLFLLIFGAYYFEWDKKYLRFLVITYSILLGLRYLRFIISTNKIAYNHLFYFILYLCTLEIAPFFLIYKWAIQSY